ncbi:MAG: hypothetical protein IKO36_05345 [Bacteroidaceae bacterium]|nr:hypothetical protein [Bacteroidaceae bacterium]
MIKKLSSLILLLLICISNAFAGEVHADLTTYKSKGSNIDISDWENKQILTWTGGTDNMIRLSGLTLGDLSDYSQLVVKSSDAGTDGSQSAATGFRILIYHGSENVQIEVNSLGTETYNLSELGIDITNVTDICVAGIRYNPGGSVKIDDVYLVESEPQQEHATLKDAKSYAGNVTQSDWTEKSILTWTGSWSNAIELKGLPIGDLSEYTQLVAVSSSANGEGSKANASNYRIIMYFSNGKSQETIYVDELGTYVYDLSKLGDKIFYVTQICVSGAHNIGEGSVKIDDVYLVKANKIYAEQAGSTTLDETLFKNHNGDGEVTGNAGENNIGKSVSGLIYGDTNVHYLNYADLSEYDYMMVEGDPNNRVRIVANRLSDPDNKGNLAEFTYTIGSTGILKIDLHEFFTIATVQEGVSRDFFHLNSIKTPWNETSTVNSIKLYKNDTPVAYTLKGAGNFDASVANALNDPTAEYYDAEYLKSAITLNPANPNALIYARENVVTRENNANIVVNNECSNLMLVDKKPFSLQKTLTLGNPARFTMVMSSAGMATIVLPFDAILPSGVSAYKIVNTNEEMALTEECDAIQKNQPVLIVGGEGEYTFYGLQEDTELPATTGDLTSGLLVGTYKDIEVPDGCYLLQNHSGEVGFYYVNNDISSFGLKPFHAYLYQPLMSAKSIKILIDDSANGVNSVKSVSNAPKAAFNIAGQEVSPNAKGFVIVNGIKVYNK